MFNLNPQTMKPGPKPKPKTTATELIKEIKRRTRRLFSSEEKIRIVLEGLRGEESVAAICRKYNIHQNLYFKWSKDFMEAGKKRLSGDTVREANTDEVKELKDQNADLKQELAELYLQNKILKKNLKGYI
jgi:transposase